MDTLLENEIAKRFGVLPNFFRLSAADPKIAANLWGFAQFAYLDKSLPSLFKERLFVYLSMANWQIGLNTVACEVLLPLPGCATSSSCSFM